MKKTNEEKDFFRTQVSLSHRELFKLIDSIEKIEDMFLYDEEKHYDGEKSHIVHSLRRVIKFNKKLKRAEKKLSKKFFS